MQSGGRRLLLLDPPRMIQSGASGLISLHVLVVVFWPLLLVLPRVIQSRGLHGLVTASLHHQGLVPVSASLHYHGPSSSLLHRFTTALASGLLLCFPIAPPHRCCTASPRPCPLHCIVGGAWRRDAVGDTQASRQARHCAHRGILTEQRVLGSLPLCNKTKVCTNKTHQGMYTGGFSHELG